MLATRLEDPRRLADPRYSASRSSTASAPSSTCATIHRPRLQPSRRRAHPGSPGSRGSVTFAGPSRGRAGRRGGGGDRSEGIQAVFEARHRAGSPMAFVAFDLLELDGLSVLARPGRRGGSGRRSARGAPDRRPPRARHRGCAGALGHLGWDGRRGNRRSRRRRPRSTVPASARPAWLKLKPKLTLAVAVTGGSDQRIRWGDWGEAVMLEFSYTHPRTGADLYNSPGRAGAAGSALRSQDRRARGAGVLGRDAEWDASAIRCCSAPEAAPSAASHRQLERPDQEDLHLTPRDRAAWTVPRGARAAASRDAFAGELFDPPRKRMIGRHVLEHAGRGRWLIASPVLRAQQEDGHLAPVDGRVRAIPKRVCAAARRDPLDSQVLNPSGEGMRGSARPRSAYL